MQVALANDTGKGPHFSPPGDISNQDSNPHLLIGRQILSPQSHLGSWTIQRRKRGRCGEAVWGSRHGCFSAQRLQRQELKLLSPSKRSPWSIKSKTVLQASSWSSCALAQPANFRVIQVVTQFKIPPSAFTASFSPSPEDRNLSHLAAHFLLAAVDVRVPGDHWMGNWKGRTDTT